MRVETMGMTPQRERQAVLTARSILRAYGRVRAQRRAMEMSSGTRDLSEGNRQFYDRVSKLVQEGVENGTVNGKEMAWS